MSAATAENKLASQTALTNAILAKIRFEALARKLGPEPSRASRQLLLAHQGLWKKYEGEREAAIKVAYPDEPQVALAQQRAQAERALDRARGSCRCELCAEPKKTGTPARPPVKPLPHPPAFRTVRKHEIVCSCGWTTSRPLGKQAYTVKEARQELLSELAYHRAHSTKHGGTPTPEMRCARCGDLYKNHAGKLHDFESERDI